MASQSSVVIATILPFFFAEASPATAFTGSSGVSRIRSFVEMSLNNDLRGHNRLHNVSDIYNKRRVGDRYVVESSISELGTADYADIDVHYIPSYGGKMVNELEDSESVVLKYLPSPAKKDDECMTSKETVESKLNNVG
ncbi:hypothetical protein Tco_0578088, partial [Tanacetum coccineum]